LVFANLTPLAWGADYTMGSESGLWKREYHSVSAWLLLSEIAVDGDKKLA